MSGSSCCLLCLLCPFTFQTYGSVRHRATRGALHWMGGVATLGLLFLTPFLKDTAHHCPKCGRNVAVAKLM